MRRLETPLRAISAYCLAECCLGKPHRVDACQEPSCPLYAFRYGTDPYKEERPGGAVSSRRGRATVSDLVSFLAVSPSQILPGTGVDGISVGRMVTPGGGGPRRPAGVGRWGR